MLRHRLTYLILIPLDTAHLSGMARRLYIHSAKVNYTTKYFICNTFVGFLYLCTNNSLQKIMALVMISLSLIGGYKQKLSLNIDYFYRQNSLNLRRLCSKIKCRRDCRRSPEGGDNRETGARPVQSRCRKEQLFSPCRAQPPGNRGQSA